MIYQEYRDSPQEMWVVTEETMQNNRDAVCAYLAGWIAAKQWLSEGTITRTTRRKASP
jgi:Asp-tRNA(Asn)/Glu-tRNA(Gln) amidotransferase B subunit